MSKKRLVDHETQLVLDPLCDWQLVQLLDSRGHTLTTSYATVRRPSVSPIYRLRQQRAAARLQCARRSPQQQDTQQHGVQQQMRAVSRCQLTSEAEHRLVLNALKHVETLIVTGVVERFSVLCKVKIVINSK